MESKQVIDLETKTVSFLLSMSTDEAKSKNFNLKVIYGIVFAQGLISQWMSLKQTFKQLFDEELASTKLSQKPDKKFGTTSSLVQHTLLKVNKSTKPTKK